MFGSTQTRAIKAVTSPKDSSHSSQSSVSSNGILSSMGIRSRPSQSSQSQAAIRASASSVPVVFF
ncbi:hypothetical protein EWM64_g9033 [Hericium alpestre]|uniref:Uncharacterized protein n=1 Tax=Hericium alpestre TaxID=135208 RepID=A0A4Y9ZNH9_9AGAM|nr:hypothetical protein EWM64_g9033 [Hericium alpestre]